MNYCAVASATRGSVFFSFKTLNAKLVIMGLFLVRYLHSAQPESTECLLDLLPIELIREIALCDWRVYHSLAVGYPRFGRSIMSVDAYKRRFIECHIGKFTEYEDMGAVGFDWEVRARYMTVGRAILSIDNHPAIETPCKKYYVFDDHIRIVDWRGAGSEFVYTSCAHHQCINKLIWGDRIRSQQLAMTPADILNRRPFYSMEISQPIGAPVDPRETGVRTCVIAVPTAEDVQSLRLPPIRVAVEQLRVDNAFNRYGINLMH